MPSRRQLIAALVSGSTVGTAGCLTGSPPTTPAGTPDRTMDETSGSDRTADEASASSSTPPADSGTPRSNPGFRLVLVDAATDTTTELATGDDVASAGEIRETRGGYGVPLSLTDAGTTRFAEAFRAADVAAEAGAHEIRLVVDGERRSAFGVAPGLAQAVQSGDWDGELLVQVGDRATAERIRRAVTS